MAQFRRVPLLGASRALPVQPTESLLDLPARLESAVAAAVFGTETTQARHFARLAYGLTCRLFALLVLGVSLMTG
jgi:hypothetical protein